MRVPFHVADSKFALKGVQHALMSDIKSNNHVQLVSFNTHVSREKGYRTRFDANAQLNYVTNLLNKQSLSINIIGECERNQKPTRKHN